MNITDDIVGIMIVYLPLKRKWQVKIVLQPITTGKKGETINIRNEFFVSTPRPSALRSAVLYTGTYVMVPIPYIGMYMMMDFTHTLILAVGIGDLPSPTRGDGDYIILIGRGEVLGMPDGMILGIGDRTGIIRIGDIPH